MTPLFQLPSNRFQLLPTGVCSNPPNTPHPVGTGKRAVGIAHPFQPWESSCLIALPARQNESADIGGDWPEM